MNSNDNCWQLYLQDTFGEDDDAYGVLVNMITEDVLNKFENNEIPPYTLELKLGNLRMVVLEKAYKNNEPNCVTYISKYRIIVWTLE